MNETVTLEQAGPELADRCYAILDEGRTFQQEQGFRQWDENYPTPNHVKDDIEEGKAYVLKVDGMPAGYMRIDFDGEPAYERIQGAWATEPPYAVVHRMAFSGAYRGRGLTSKTFQLIEKLCCARGVFAIRADTGFQNARMRHILEKNGFRERGTIYFQDGDKVAYDKTLRAQDAGR